MENNTEKDNEEKDKNQYNFYDNTNKKNKDEIQLIEIVAKIIVTYILKENG